MSVWGLGRLSCVRFGGIPWCLRGWVVCGLGAGVPVCLCAGLRDHVAGSGPEDVYWGKGPGCVAGLGSGYEEGVFVQWNCGRLSIVFQSS